AYIKLVLRNLAVYERLYAASQVRSLPTEPLVITQNFTFQVGRIRARYLTVRLPNPPVRTEYAAFTAHGSRNREFMVTSISSGFHPVRGVQLTRSLSTVYRFPTLFLRAFAMYVAFSHAGSYAQSDCLQRVGRF